MATKHTNPYRDGSAYSTIFAFIRKNQIVTRSQLLAQGFAVADVTVVTSPRAEGVSKRGGDCRGNMSAQGHLYFMDELKRKKGEKKRFRLRWRKQVMEKRVRPPKVKIAIQKAIKTAKEVTKSKSKEVVATA